MQGADEARIEQAMRRVKSQAPAEQIEPLAFIMAVFTAQVNHDADLARAIIRRVFMSFDIFKDSPLYQEIIQEAAQEAAEKAAKEAAEKAREAAQEAAEKAAHEAAEKAAQETRSQSTHIALEGRFGALSEDMTQALNAAGEPTLTAILAHISSDTLAQVRERLGLKPQG
jgi:predicted transposase YdaD